MYAQQGHTGVHRHERWCTKYTAHAYGAHRNARYSRFRSDLQFTHNTMHLMMMNSQIWTPEYKNPLSRLSPAVALILRQPQTSKLTDAALQPLVEVLDAARRHRHHLPRPGQTMTTSSS